MANSSMHTAMKSVSSRIIVTRRNICTAVAGGCVIVSLLVAYTLLIDRRTKSPRSQFNEKAFTDLPLGEPLVGDVAGAKESHHVIPIIQVLQHDEGDNRDIAQPDAAHDDGPTPQMRHRGVLTPQSQLLYVVQWLGEFSEIEKDDFLQELLDLYAPGQLPMGQVLERVKFEGRPPTLFQCRMDLLKEWFESWSPEAEREQLLSRIRESDLEFFERFDKSRSIPNEEKVVEEFWTRNGNCNATVYGFTARNGYTVSEGDENGPAVEQNLDIGGIIDEEYRQNGLGSPADKDVASEGTTEGSNESGVNQISAEDDCDDFCGEKSALTSPDKHELQTSAQNPEGDGNTETKHRAPSAESYLDSVQTLIIGESKPAETDTNADETAVPDISSKCRGDMNESIELTSAKTEVE